MVIDACVASIVATGYPRLSIVCVDDGSSDDTFARMQRLAAGAPRGAAIHQDNAGKGAALNTGVDASQARSW